jgi:hypothetical protein
MFKKLGIVFALVLLLAGNASAGVILSKQTAKDLAGGRAAVNVLLQGTTFSYVDGGAGNDQIADSGNGLGVFHVGDMITVEGSTSNDGTYKILAVAASGATIDVGTGLLTTEAAGDQTALASARGMSLSDIFRRGVIRIYSGTQPASPETAESGTLLLEITESSGAFVAGADANGLLFDAVTCGASSCSVAKDLNQVWSDAGIATGSAGWGRLYDNAMNVGADGGAAYRRIDFSVGTAGNLVMSPSVTTGVTKTIDEFTLTVPLQ